MIKPEQIGGVDTGWKTGSHKIHKMKLQAAIVETRELKNIREIVWDRHLKFLPEGTPCIFFHGQSNYHFLLRELDGLNIIYVPVTANALSSDRYNQLLTTKSFWEYFSADRVLIFQHDSRLLRTGIEQFYEYDYVGAPWKFQTTGGNGGLSLRSPKAMLQILMRYQYNQQHHGNEDVFFSNHINLVGGNLGNYYICSEFSCETIFKLGTLGCHAIEKYLNHSEVEQILNQYK